MARITNDILAEKIENLTLAITKLESRFDQFTPTNVLELKLKEIDTQILELRGKDRELEISINTMKRRSNLQVWITGTLSAALGATMTFLIVFFLTHIG